MIRRGRFLIWIRFLFKLYYGEKYLWLMGLAKWFSWPQKTYFCASRPEQCILNYQNAYVGFSNEKVKVNTQLSLLSSRVHSASAL